MGKFFKSPFLIIQRKSTLLKWMEHWNIVVYDGGEGEGRMALEIQVLEGGLSTGGHQELRTK